eukprot:scaffold8079_cov267-Pinguiococcus_pyrenoidosus.AAC.4
MSGETGATRWHKGFNLASTQRRLGSLGPTWSADWWHGHGQIKVVLGPGDHGALESAGELGDQRILNALADLSRTPCSCSFISSRRWGSSSCRYPHHDDVAGGQAMEGEELGPRRLGRA